MSDPTREIKKASPLVGVIKPSRKASKSYNDLIALLPSDIKFSARYAPVENGELDEFARVIPAYAAYAAELAAEGADLIHPEGTPPFFILGYTGEQRTIAQWEEQFGIPFFTSGMCQVNALRALGVRKLVDAGYDPTTGPHAESYFRDAGFDVLGVEKIPVDWGADGDIGDDDAYAMIAGIVRRHPGVEGVCLQGSSKWRISPVIARVEDDLGVAVVHPIAARYWELMARFGRQGNKPELGRLLATMPRHPGIP